MIEVKTLNFALQIFRANKKPKGRFIRHWLRHKIAARYVKFRATKWKRPLCLHIEIYGWGERKIRTDFLRRNNGRSSPIFQELSMGRKERKDDEKLEKGNSWIMKKLDQGMCGEK
jgi:hypothetical protein